MACLHALNFQETPMIDRYLPLLRAAMAAVLSVAAGGVQAQANLEQMTQRWLDDALARNMPTQSPLRMEVSVGALDERLRLAPCARVEPYLPAGARLWGRTRLGLRCQEGAVRWTVFLPVTVKAYGPAWVLTGDVTMGTALTEADATQAEVDWAAENTSILAESSLWVGQVASRHLKAGQALRQSMLRAPQVFQAGALVRVVAQGQGYAVSAAGQAMSAGAAGQTVRIRMENGKIVSGIVNDDGTISVQL
jgi:flagella basal body P-ring formation protein FlgA